MTAWRERVALTSHRCRGLPRSSPFSTIRRTGCCRPTRLCGSSRVCSATMPKPLPPTPRSFRRKGRGRLPQKAAQSLTALAPLLAARARGGYVRHCHGDLHLRNIVEIDGSPVLFDALEFDDRLATIDLLYDLAFLLMDLGKRGLMPHANAVLNAYLDADGETGNLIGLAALPLFLSMRAAVRAKVELLRARMAAPDRAASVREEARAYFDLAQNFLASPFAAPHCHRRIVGERQVGRGPRDRPSHRRLSRARCMCEAMSSGSACSARRRSKGCRPKPIRKRSRSRFTPRAASAP